VLAVALAEPEHLSPCRRERGLEAFALVRCGEQDELAPRARDEGQILSLAEPLEQRPADRPAQRAQLDARLATPWSQEPARLADDPRRRSLPHRLEVGEADRDHSLAAIGGGQCESGVVAFFCAGETPHALGGLEAKGGGSR
jgi:hypothetical protein